MADPIAIGASNHKRNEIPPGRLVGRDARFTKATMPKYVIERELPGAGKLSHEQLQAVAQKSCTVLTNMGPQIQWLHSYVTGDKIYCVYIAANEQLVRDHAKQGGFPANRISKVTEVIDPTTAEPFVSSQKPAMAPA